MYCYRIGDLDIIWPEENFPLLQDEIMREFRTDPDAISPDALVFRSEMCDLLSICTGEMLESNALYERYSSDNGDILLYHWLRSRCAFAIRLPELERGNTVPCYFDLSMKSRQPLPDVRFFSLAGLHSKFLQRGGLILHASYVIWRGQALLFTAPSGIGKSTQAELWHKYAGAEVINGDRVLLRQRSGVWYAHGYPCSGSSNICINKSAPLRAVVILEQSSENAVMPVSMARKQRALISGAEVYRWNLTEIERALTLVSSIAEDVNVLQLKCRPEKEAVLTLRRYLEEI